MKPSERKVFRCAIYTRKSTEHNLDLEFNSLDAQREACEAYIKSQAHEGWWLVADHYDDGGVSGRQARDTDREIITTKRGKRIATSIDGTLTGLGGNLIIIDDPLKLGDAMSEAVRARVIEWYRSTLLTRADDKTVARIVLVMQRVHQDDLAGYLQDKGGFDVLNLPAVAQRSQTYDLGGGRTFIRQKGALLHPEHEPADVLIELKREMGPIAFSAQYQQTCLL